MRKNLSVLCTVAEAIPRCCRCVNYRRKQYNQCNSVMQAGSTRLKRGATQVASERSSMRRL